MHEEVHGAQRAADQALALQRKCATQEAELLKFQQKRVTDADRKFIEYFCDRNAVVTLHEFAQHFSVTEAKAQHICDSLRSWGFIRRTSLSNVDPRWETLSETNNSGYEITEEGRKFRFE